MCDIHIFINKHNIIIYVHKYIYTFYEKYLILFSIQSITCVFFIYLFYCYSHFDRLIKFGTEFFNKNLSKFEINIFEFYNYLIKYYNKNDVIEYYRIFCIFIF